MISLIWSQEETYFFNKNKNKWVEIIRYLLSLFQIKFVQICRILGRLILTRNHAFNLPSFRIKSYVCSFWSRSKVRLGFSWKYLWMKRWIFDERRLRETFYLWPTINYDTYSRLERISSHIMLPFPYSFTFF